MGLETITRIDPHVHSFASDMPFGHTITRRLGVRDCYNKASVIYELAKKRGMDYVAITDHNIISSETLSLANAYDDVIVGCELETNVSAFEQPFSTHINPYVPVIHIVVLGLDERQYLELNRLRYVGLQGFASVLASENLAYFWAHPAYSEHPSAPMTPALMEDILPFFRCIATRNGQMRHENCLAKVLASVHGKQEVGESDSHVYRTIGRTWTGTKGSVTKETLLQRFKDGEIFSGGSSGALGIQKKVFIDLKDAYYTAEMALFKESGFFKNLYADPVKYATIKSMRLLRFVLNRIMGFELRMHWRNQKERLRKLEKDYVDGNYHSNLKDLLWKAAILERQNPDGVYSLDEEIGFELYVWLTSFWKRYY